MTMTSPMDVRPACNRRAAVRVFYLLRGLVWVCEVQLFHIGKTKGNPYLVCENECFHMIKNSGNPSPVWNNYFPLMATQTRSRSNLTKRWTKLRFLSDCHTLPDSANGRVTDSKILCPFMSVRMRFLSVRHACVCVR